MPDTTIVLSGRIFKKAESTTIDQDAYVIQRMRAAGISDLAAKFDPKKQGLESFAEELLLAAFESGQLFEILAGTLVEEGVPWSRATAKANAEFFLTLKDKADKEAIYDRMAQVILDFLVVAAAWSNSSRKSSQLGGQSLVQNLNRNSEETQSSTSESGTPSSEK